MSNRLIKESSPYLRQHSENPVDWYPWGEEAFEKARREDKPVFLSIGYSTCHWCHVMAHESFENKALADILNENYVSVKVDREERPDVDSVYMQACVALNGSGGWPLTVVMTPEQQPFFVGTYLPPENRGGRLGLMSLLEALSLKWRNERSDLVKSTGDIMNFLRREARRSRGRKQTELPERAAAQLMASYDEEYGGFGRAPKFPSPQNLLMLLEQSKLTGVKAYRQAVENTLRQMYRGGIYDHFGGGFCRYSTDREWLAPHFEKTLYDNAMLALCYTEAFQEGHMALYREVAESTLDYCLRELKAPEGGFYSGQDADSQGQEGAYYLFSEEEICTVLGGEAGKHFAECYDITKEGNFQGKSIPNLLLNTRWNLLPEGYSELREKLRLYREERMALFTDEKLLLGRNGLMLMALARAARVFDDRRYLMEARELAEFIDAAFTKDGKLCAVRMAHELKHPAALDDICFYALGLLELYDADFDVSRLERARELAAMLGSYSDNSGGFYSSSDKAEKLIFRPKEIHDGACPSGNTAAAALLSRLWRMTGDTELGSGLKKQLDFIASSLGDYPAGGAFAMTALYLDEHGSREMVCASPDGSLPPELKAVLSRWEPELTVLLKTPENAERLAAIAPFTAGMQPVEGKAAYYICKDGSCSMPVTY